jgi:3-isopropylmalate/(R)-2-methylmalate dehydratase small subunit
MDKFTTLEGVAAPLKMINVDTDMIIPKQYLKTIKRTGLGSGLFSEKRYRDDGSENPDFVLNKPAYRKAKILVAGDNFGCGSSREHAPWALMDFGIRCVISTSFGDIFYNNCFKNGILPIQVSPEDLEKLFDDAERGANATLTIDLPKQEIRGPDGGVVKFEIDPHRKDCLLNGLDDIGLTMMKKNKIDTFESKLKAERPWPSGCHARESGHPVNAECAMTHLMAPSEHGLVGNAPKPGLLLPLRTARFARRDRIGDRYRAARDVDVQALYHAAVERDHALALILRQIERCDDAACLRDLFGARRKGRVGGVDLARVND